MDLHLLALYLMAAQGLLGAFDTVFHHELTETLPQRRSAALELRIHSIRALIYGALFIGLAGWRWQGGWAVVLFALFAIEIGLTLWDFVTEDRTRLLPATERVTHTVLAINGGAFIALLAVQAWQTRGLPSALVWLPHGALSVFLALCGVGVIVSGLRDAAAARALGTRRPASPIRFGDRSSTVLVTGATGFIGQELVHALLADGHEVVVWSRRPRHAAWLFEGRARCYARLEEIPRHVPIDVVVNLAGARVLGMPWTAGRRQALLRSRVGLTRELVAWMERLPRLPRLLLNASAVGYYGVQQAGDDAALTESHPGQDVFMSRLCREWEEAASRAQGLGVATCCMRFGLVLGHGGPLPALLLPAYFGLGGPLGDGRQWYSWIHIEDLLRAMAHLWSQPSAPAVQAFNFTAPEPLRQADFMRVVCRTLNRPCGFPTPAWPMRLLLGEQSTVLLDGQRVTPERLLARGFKFSYPDLPSAIGHLTERASGASTAREVPLA